MDIVAEVKDHKLIVGSVVVIASGWYLLSRVSANNANAMSQAQAQAQAQSASTMLYMPPTSGGYTSAGGDSGATTTTTTNGGSPSSDTTNGGSSSNTIDPIALLNAITANTTPPTNTTDTSFNTLLASILAGMGGTNTTKPPTPTQPTITQDNSNIAKGVTALYQHYLGRAPDASGLNYYTANIQSGNETASDVANSMTHSAEYQGNQINQVFQSTLGRSVDPSGQAYYTQELNSGLTIQDVTNQIQHSPEYLQAHPGAPS